MQIPYMWTDIALFTFSVLCCFSCQGYDSFSATADHEGLTMRKFCITNQSS
ncbi:hypothetical protein FKM82_008290 [Ascaphus truei]